MTDIGHSSSITSLRHIDNPNPICHQDLLLKMSKSRMYVTFLGDLVADIWTFTLWYNILKTCTKSGTDYSMYKAALGFLTVKIC